jgi:16S rRNA (guanine527-N7)-methyltransferase
VSREDERLRAVLVRGRTLGFLGPGPIEGHLAHAAGFAIAAIRQLEHPPASILDLGSGAGIPGLVLAEQWPDARAVLVESGHRRCEHLRREIDALGWAGRVAVLEERAEHTARRTDLREQLELVTARSFATPAATAEIAAGLVAPGGLLVVSEPPQPDRARWPLEELGALGFGPPRYEAVAAAHFACFVKIHRAPIEVPRAVGRPAKRPRW